jgi:hypothetical protein
MLKSESISVTSLQNKVPHTPIRHSSKKLLEGAFPEILYGVPGPFNSVLGLYHNFTNKGVTPVQIWSRVPNSSVPSMLSYEEFQQELLNPLLFAPVGQYYRNPIVYSIVLAPDETTTVFEGVVYFKFL